MATRRAGGTVLAMHRTPSFQERFCRERAFYEQVILARLGTALTREDAQDIVSDAIIHRGAQCPPDAKAGGRPWFMRVVLNRAEDFRRARYGRPRSTRGGGRGGAAAPRRLVSLDEIGERALSSGPFMVDESAVTAAVERESDRAEAAALVGIALAALDDDLASVIRLRYLTGDEPQPRCTLAARLGLSIAQYEARHTRAWKAFALAVADAR
jgi:DNA-directed RNA polymerase specialized sigma24 family protein